MEFENISSLVKDFLAQKRSITETTQSCLDRLDETEEYHTTLSLNDEALERAQALEQQVALPEAKDKPLYGVPFLAKDNFLTRETTTTAASNILDGFRSPYQATAVKKLQEAGAILLGKTNLDAFAHGSSTENSDFGPTLNPHDKTRVPGGSSGGSAAAVALNQAAFALGTDTGGSIRLPASYCGVVGLKPTYGLVSRYGVVAMASSTDVIGPLTKNVGDTALVLDCLAGKDPRDGTTIEREDSYLDLEAAESPTVGIVKEYLEELDQAEAQVTQEVIDQLQDLGWEISEVSIPSQQLALAVYYILVPAEISSNLARYDGIKYGLGSDESQLMDYYEDVRARGFNAENKRRIMIGTYVLSSGYHEAYYQQAQIVRTRLINEFDQAFQKADVLLGPTAATTAFELGSKQDPLSMYLTDKMTVAANLVGVPAISVPGVELDGMPYGLQLMAPQTKEKRLLQTAQRLEEVL